MANKFHRPLLTSKPVVALVSAGDAAMFPGGSAFARTTLEPHLTTMLTFNGITDIMSIRVGDEEKPGESRIALGPRIRMRFFAFGALSQPALEARGWSFAGRFAFQSRA